MGGREKDRYMGHRLPETDWSSLQSWKRENSRLQAHFLQPTVLPEGSAYNMAEPSNHSRDLREKTEYTRVRMVVKALTVRQKTETKDMEPGGLFPSLAELSQAPHSRC